ncbi:MAG: hypothetical protein AAF108_01805 [Planctomycetota bacterium]
MYHTPESNPSREPHGGTSRGVRVGADRGSALSRIRALPVDLATVSRVAERNTPWMGMMLYLSSMPVALVAAAAVFGLSL